MEQVIKKVREIKLTFPRINILITLGSIMLIIILFTIVFGPSLCKNDPIGADLSVKIQSPSLEYPMGTDGMGRSVAARVVYGARISVGVALVVVISSAIIGISIGIISGYVGGVVDAVFMRIVEVMLAFPGTVLALAILGTIGIGIKNQIIALIVVRWAEYARLARGETLLVKKSEYIEAARAMGNSKWRIMIKYVLPNIYNRMIVIATMSIGHVVLAGAALSYLGLGAQIPTPEWGLMINEGREFIRTAPHITIFPGLATIFTGLCFNLLGEGMNDLIDPRLKEKVMED